MLQLGKAASPSVHGWAQRSTEGKRCLQLHTTSMWAAQITRSLTLLPNVHLWSQCTVGCSHLWPGSTVSGRALGKSLALQKQQHLLLLPILQEVMECFWPAFWGLTHPSQRHRLNYTHEEKNRFRVQRGLTDRYFNPQEYPSQPSGLQHLLLCALLKASLKS